MRFCAEIGERPGDPDRVRGHRRGARETSSPASDGGGGGLRVHGAGPPAPVRLVYYDDASSAARAAANTERLLDADAVEILIGPYGSDLTRAVLPVAGRRGRLAWNHGGASDDIHLEGGRAVGILTPVTGYFARLIELARRLDSDAARVAHLHRRGSRFGRLAALGVGRRTSRGGFASIPQRACRWATRWSSCSGGGEGSSLSGRPLSPRPGPYTRGAVAGDDQAGLLTGARVRA